jgi:hypothetical protein
MNIALCHAHLLRGAAPASSNTICVPKPHSARGSFLLNSPPIGTP